MGTVSTTKSIVASEVPVDKFPEQTEIFSTQERTKFFKKVHSSLTTSRPILTRNTITSSKISDTPIKISEESPLEKSSDNLEEVSTNRGISEEKKQVTFHASHLLQSPAQDLCPDSEFTYIIPHPEQCDAFYLCKRGVRSYRVCPPGLIFSVLQVECRAPLELDCRERPYFQQTRPTATPRKEEVRPTETPEQKEVGPTTTPRLEEVGPTTTLRQDVIEENSSFDSSREENPVPGQNFEDTPLASSLDTNPIPQCPDSLNTYLIPHPAQCDAFFLCQRGSIETRLCPDGLIFSVKRATCLLPNSEDCAGRPILQASTGSGPCPRRNGLFYYKDSCDKYQVCEDDQSSVMTCGEGLVFDTKKKVCASPDEALRPGCLPVDLFDFRCPDPVSTGGGVHHQSRHADSSDCRFYFTCSSPGQPHRESCGSGLVFSPSEQVCRTPQNVPGCENYYFSQLKAKIFFVS